MEKDKNKDKEHEDGETVTSSETITSPRDASPTETSARTGKQGMPPGMPP